MIMERAYCAANSMRMACTCVEDGRLKEAEQLVRNVKELAEKLLEEIQPKTRPPAFRRRMKTMTTRR